MFIALVPTGTSGDVVVTASASAVRCGVSLYSLTGITSTTPIATSSFTTVGGGTFGSFTLPAAGHTIAIGYNGNGSSRHSTASEDLASGSPTITSSGSSTNTTWTLLTEDYEGVLEAPSTTLSAWLVASWAIVSGTSYTLTAASVSYALTGSTALLKVGRKITAASAAYALTASSTALKTGRKLTAASAAYTFTASTANLKIGRKLTAASAAFTLSASSTNLQIGRKLAAASVAFTLSASSTNLKLGRKLVAASAAYSVTFSSTLLTPHSGPAAYTLPAASASFALSLSGVSFPVKRKLVAGSTSFALTAFPVAFHLGKTLAAGSVAYVFTPTDGTFTYTAVEVVIRYPTVERPGSKRQSTRHGQVSSTRHPAVSTRRR
jgi:hypothetical protein